MVVSNFEYRFPIAGPVTLAYFVDLGTDFVLRASQLQIQTASLTSIATQFPSFTVPKNLHIIGSTNYRPRSSTGLALQVILPVVNAPFNVFYGYNWMRLNTVVVPPQVLPSRALFPNEATYDQILPFFQGLRLRERKGRVGFTVARTF